MAIFNLFAFVWVGRSRTYVRRCSHPVDIIVVRKPFSMSSIKQGGRHNFSDSVPAIVNPREAGGVNIVRDLGLFCCVHMRACVDPIRENRTGTIAPVPE